MIEEHDQKGIRCPRIGGEVNFRFCRLENRMLPCRYIVGCWQLHFDIVAFLEGHYSEQELKEVFAPPRPKMATLLELVEKARKQKG